MRKLALVLLLLCVTVWASGCDRTPTQPAPGLQEHVAQIPVTQYWWSDYLPLNPGLYGIKTYEFTVGQSGQFTSQIVGTETVPYSTGDLTGVVATFFGSTTSSMVVNRYLWPLRSLENRVPSSTCGALVYPHEVIIGQVYDGMILDRRGVGNWEVNINDLDDCEELGYGDSRVDLIHIRDVHIQGRRYNNAIVAWELEPKLYPAVKFESPKLRGKEQEWGLAPLPTSDETNDWAVADVVIYGRKKGVLAIGLIGESTGVLEGAIELVSVTHRR